MGISQYTEVLKQWNYTKPKSLAEALVYIFYIYYFSSGFFYFIVYAAEIKRSLCKNVAMYT